MESIESLQARRDAQVLARRQAATSAASTALGGTNLLYGPSLVPPAPGSAAVVKPATPPPAATPFREEQPVNYAQQAGIFIPEGAVTLSPASRSPPNSDPERAEKTGAAIFPVTMDSSHPFVAPPPPPRQARFSGHQPGAGGDDAPQVSKLTVAQRATFIPKQQLLLGYVIREKGGIMDNAKYRFFFESRDIFVMAGRKRSKKQSSNYVISLDPNDLDRDSDNCFVKLRSNFAGTEFTFFTTERDYRRELGAVVYEVNPAGIRGPRRMTVVIPAFASNGVAEEWVCKDDETPLLDEFKANPSSNRIIVLRNRVPQWSESLKGYQLNFGGRIGMASVKNFQLALDNLASTPQSPLATLNSPSTASSDSGDSAVVMQFGKWSKDRFSLDFKFPLNATQAFCIALTAFDNKLLCE